jgi:hypothetical protein
MERPAFLTSLMEEAPVRSTVTNGILINSIQNKE